MGVSAGDLRALLEGGTKSQESDLERVLCQYGLPPEICHPAAERVAAREAATGLSYSPETLGVLTAVWEAAGYPWSVRLKALLPPWLPWIRERFRLRPEIERQLLRISARQIDRRLRAQKTEKRRCLYGRTKPGYLLKHQIPVKTDHWDVQRPGFTEVDLVAHSGNFGSGEFAHTPRTSSRRTGRTCASYWAGNAMCAWAAKCGASMMSRAHRWSACGQARTRKRNRWLGWRTCERVRIHFNWAGASSAN
jgi:hypothetical protein